MAELPRLMTRKGRAEHELAKQANAPRAETPVPEEILAKKSRAEKDTMPYESGWDECLAFFDNDQYVEQSAVDGSLQRVETGEGSIGKPRWRPRLTANRYTPAIEKTRSRFASRVPVPRCSAPSHNYDAHNAATLGEKALLSAYRKLNAKQLVLDCMVYTFNCGAGYVWSYWDGNTGSYMQDPITGKVLQTGEIGNWLLGPRDVMWEPGVPFRESRWWIVRRAEPVSKLKAEEDYIGPAELTSDTTEVTRSKRVRDVTSHELVMKYHYLERPSKRYQQGRWIQFVGNTQIKAEAAYPCDEDIPVIHELADISRPHRTRPMGRGELMLDIQRVFQRTRNQIILWKDLVLNPQLLAPKNSIEGKLTAEPGAIIHFKPVAGMEPKWREIQEIPTGLFRVIDQCLADWDEITGEGDLPAGLESGSAVASVRTERDESRRATFAANLSAFYQSLFQHWLYLMQHHYSEPRILEVKTRFGTESIPDFLGAKLMSGITVNVDEGSVTPRTREEQEAKLILYADRGWIPGHAVIAALRSGDADMMIDEYELDVGKAHREIQQLIAMARGEGEGPVFAAPYDNHEVGKYVLGSWMKTEDFERQPEEVKQAAMAHFEQHEAELQFQAVQQQMATQNAAADRGLASATKGPNTDVGGGSAPPPSYPSVESNVRGLQGIPQRAGT